MNKAMLVTGGVRNTGLAIAKRFAQAGWDVIVTSRNEEDSVRTANELLARYPSLRFMGVRMETNDVSSIREAYAHVREQFPVLHAFVANAASLGIDKSILNAEEQDWDEVMNANAKGAFFGAQEAVRLMTEGGTICFISSVHSHACIPARVLYSASKGAVNAISRALAIELGHLNIRVNTLIAGAIHTQRWDVLSPEEDMKRRLRYPAGRESMPEDIAEGVYFLCSDKAPTMTGSEMTIDSGIEACLLPYQKEWNRS